MNAGLKGRTMCWKTGIKNWEMLTGSHEDDRSSDNTIKLNELKTVVMWKWNKWIDAETRQWIRSKLFIPFLENFTLYFVAPAQKDFLRLILIFGDSKWYDRYFFLPHTQRIKTVMYVLLLISPYWNNIPIYVSIDKKQISFPRNWPQDGI